MSLENINPDDEDKIEKKLKSTEQKKYEPSFLSDVVSSLALSLCSLGFFWNMGEKRNLSQLYFIQLHL